MPQETKRASDMDYQIGQAIANIRQIKGMSQTTLGEALDVTFQQVQKYEKGQNRLSVVALIKICRKLEISPMEIIGSYVGQPSETTGLAAHINKLNERLARIRSIATEK